MPGPIAGPGPMDMEAGPKAGPTSEADPSPYYGYYGGYHGYYPYNYRYGYHNGYLYGQFGTQVKFCPVQKICRKKICTLGIRLKLPICYNVILKLN